MTYRLLPNVLNLEVKSCKNPHRLENQICRLFSKAIGIANHPVFYQRLDNKTDNHSRAADRFTPNPSSTFFKSANDNIMPFVAGPSGHTATFIKGAMRLGINNQEELKAYSLAVFAFLTGGGNHSFHEVMTVAREIGGIDYKDGNYFSVLPDCYLESKEIAKLNDEFDQYVELNKLKR